MWSEWGCCLPTRPCVSDHRTIPGMPVHPSWASWWGAQSTMAKERLRARKWSPLRIVSVKTGPQTVGAESQSFSHSLLISPLFCLLSQFQFLRSKTLLIVKGVRSSTCQNSCTPFCYLSVQQKQPCAGHLEITRGRILRNNSHQKLFVLKLMTKVCACCAHLTGSHEDHHFCPANTCSYKQENPILIN